MHKIIYFDNNATTPIDPEVLDAMTQELVAPPHNPSSIHSLGQEAKKVLTSARKTIADFLKVKPSEVLFTSSGTEAMNLLIRGILADPKVHIIGSSTDHACVYHALLELQKRGSEVTFLGIPTLSNIKKALRNDTRLLSYLQSMLKPAINSILKALPRSQKPPIFLSSSMASLFLAKNHSRFPKG